MTLTLGQTRRTIAYALAIPLLTAALPAASLANDAAMEPQALIDAMKEGGHVVFIRHATTEKDYADQVDAVMGDCSTQRTLSEAGWEEAKALGEAFRKHEIPVGNVVSSQYCRAWQTADLAFGRFEKTADLNFEPAEDYTDAQMETMRGQMVPHLSATPEEGNTVLVGHDDPFDAATGIYPEPMGVVFVLQPSGEGSFTVLGSIAPDAWP
ncbi:MAG: histidine phosphatase family protein [Pseudomonadota bacterium]